MKKAIITISILIGLCGCMRSQYMFTKSYIAGYFEYDTAYTQVDKNAYIGFFSEANMEMIVFPITTITTRHNIPFTLKNLAIHHTIEY